MLHMLERLEVTDEQREKIWAVMDKNRPTMRQHMTEMAKNRRALRQAMRAGPYDAALVRQLADRQGQLKADMIVLGAQGRQEIRALLTPEQQERFKEMKKHRRGHGLHGGW
jgi:Spy/CpxP family protein refolding chaperone